MVLIQLFFLYKKKCQRKQMHSRVLNYLYFYDMTYSFLLKKNPFLQTYKNNKLFLSMSKSIP